MMPRAFISFKKEKAISTRVSPRLDQGFSRQAVRANHEFATNTFHKSNVRRAENENAFGSIKHASQTIDVRGMSALTDGVNEMDLNQMRNSSKAQMNESLEPTLINSSSKGVSPAVSGYLLSDQQL